MSRGRASGLGPLGRVRPKRRGAGCCRGRAAPRPGCAATTAAWTPRPRDRKRGPAARPATQGDDARAGFGEAGLVSVSRKRCSHAQPRPRVAQRSGPCCARPSPRPRGRPVPAALVSAQVSLAGGLRHRRRFPPGSRGSRPRQHWVWPWLLPVEGECAGETAACAGGGGGGGAVQWALPRPRYSHSTANSLPRGF